MTYASSLKTASVPGSGSEAGLHPWLARSELFGGLAIIGFINGISERAADKVTRSGVANAIFNTFDVSVIVWAALLVALWLLLHAQRTSVGPGDIAVGVAASIAFLIPVPSLAWMAVAGMAAWLIWTSAPRSRIRRAAVLLVALTMPMLWARLLFAALSNTLLEIDAKLVSWLVGSKNSGNAIPFSDGSGMLFLEPACSSLTNLSLTLLCGVLFVKAYDRRWTVPIVVTIVLACAATLAINVMRIGVISVFPDTYEIMHGVIGGAITAWTTIITITLIYTKWIAPDAPDPA